MKAFWRKKDERLRRKAKRQRKRASRKEERAQKALSKGNTKRAERLQSKSEKLKKKADRIILWKKTLIDLRKYQASESELTMLKNALDQSRSQALKVEEHISLLDEGTHREDIEIWNNGPLGEIFGNDPSKAQVRKLSRRAIKISNALLRENLYIKVINRGKILGSAAPSVLNRPLSQNVQITIDLPNHGNNQTELADTIIHEVAHTLNVITDHPGSDTVRKALRDPDSYARFFLAV